MDVLTYIINLTRTKFYIINNNFANRKFKSLCFVYRMPQWIIYQLFPNSNVLKGLPGCSIMIKKVYNNSTCKCCMAYQERVKSKKHAKQILYHYITCKILLINIKQTLCNIKLDIYCNHEYVRSGKGQHAKSLQNLQHFDTNPE